MSLVRQRMFVFLLPVFLSLPFVGRALFVDDAFFVRIASWIKDHPAHPYDFPDEGDSVAATAPDRALRIVNPLLHHYYLAFWMKLGGDRTWIWRLGCVFLTGAGLLSVFELARRWTGHPLLTTMLIAVAPAHWLTAHSLLIDSTLGAFFFSALFFFVRWTERDKPIDAVISGVFIGMAMLSKYTGVLIFPVTAAFLWWNRRAIRRPAGAFWAWGVGAFLFGAYFFLTRLMYGTGHAWAASQQTLHTVALAKMVVFLAFLTGVTAGPALVWAAVSGRTALIGGLLVLAGGSLTATTLGGFSIANAFLFSTLVVTGILFLIVTARFFRHPVLSTDRMIAVWLFGFAAMTGVVMAWVAGRYYVIATPAAVFAGVRLLEIRRPRRSTPVLAAAVALTTIVSGALAWADYQQAETSRTVVSRLSELGFDQAPRRFYFAEMFSAAYLSKAGWRPWTSSTPLQPGDVIVVPSITLPLGRFSSQKPPVRALTGIAFPTSFPLRLMDSPAGAGFYASAWGPLPYAVSQSPYERFFVMEVVSKAP